MPNKIDASKENAKKAREALEKVSDKMLEAERTQVSADLIFLEDFIAAAERRLPTQKAIDKDKIRKKNYGKNRKSTKPKPGTPAAVEVQVPVAT